MYIDDGFAKDLVAALEASRDLFMVLQLAQQKGVLLTESSLPEQLGMEQALDVALTNIQKGLQVICPSSRPSKFVFSGVEGISGDLNS